jgi:hypothetical protein
MPKPVVDIKLLHTSLQEEFRHLQNALEDEVEAKPFSW